MTGSPSGRAAPSSRVRGSRRRWWAIAVAGCLLPLAAPLGESRAAAATAASPVGAPIFAPAIHLPGTSGRTEPRITFLGGVGVVMTNLSVASGATDAVFRSTDLGRTWHRTPAEPAGQTSASSDVDIVTLTRGRHAGRLVATELDFAGINFRTSYSDNGGRTWMAASGPGLFTGTGYADTDRPWLATGGPVDPATGYQPVYLLFHNLVSGTANHNMYVAESTDGGGSWGLPVPITYPGEQAYSDLQCADSGGPSNLFVDPRTGRVYAVWGTRSASAPLQATGGCGASVTGQFEVNVVAATRVWVASATSVSLPTGWTTSLAVDSGASGRIVGMQLSPGAIDAGRHVYIAYTKSPGSYPNYDGATLEVVRNDSPTLQQPWSAPIAVMAGAVNATAAATAATPGNVLPHIVAGASGDIALAWFHGFARPGKSPGWHVEEAESFDATSARPSFTLQDISETLLPSSAQSSRLALADMVVATHTASQLMGACGTGPTAGVQNGTVCNRATDVWGAALDPLTCLVSFTWPAASTGSGFNDVSYASNPNFFGSYVSVQTGGRRLCTPASAAGKPPVVSPASAARVAPSGAAAPTSGVLATTGGAPELALMGLSLLALAGAATLASRGRRMPPG